MKCLVLLFVLCILFANSSWLCSAQGIKWGGELSFGGIIDRQLGGGSHRRSGSGSDSAGSGSFPRRGDDEDVNSLATATAATTTATSTSATTTTTALRLCRDIDHSNPPKTDT
uniref:Uncharacterized protein n=1 Tax=Glossina palpalis gambiensis TaxID=67801 RepID=A0A1B0BFV9_9MUSC